MGMFDNYKNLSSTYIPPNNKKVLPQDDYHYFIIGGTNTYVFNYTFTTNNVPIDNGISFIIRNGVEDPYTIPQENLEITTKTISNIFVEYIIKATVIPGLSIGDVDLGSEIRIQMKFQMPDGEIRYGQFTKLTVVETLDNDF